MTYKDMLKEWRFSPFTNDRLQGEKGNSFWKIMKEKKDALPAGKAVAISKQIDF